MRLRWPTSPVRVGPSKGAEHSLPTLRVAPSTKPPGAVRSVDGQPLSLAPLARRVFCPRCRGWPPTAA